MFEFTLKNNIRLGKITTPHGPIFTPAFAPDATRGNIKSIAIHDIVDLEGKRTQKEIIEALNNHNGYQNPIFNNRIRAQNNETQFILANTYHLMSYPGDEFIKNYGGLHEFIKWPLPIITDSGGFQVFTLIHKAKHLKGKITDEGAVFRNIYNGDLVKLTPEKAIEIQFNLGADIMITLDDCRHYQDSKELAKSVYRTIEWAERGKRKFIEILNSQGLSFEKDQGDKRPLLFCVIQGGIDKKLRKLCAEKLIEIGFDGYSFGGWAINEKEYFPYDILEYVAKILPQNKPRYVLGVGTPQNIKMCIEYGYDMFDCVIPTRNARHGLAYTTKGEIKIKNKRYKKDKTILDPNLESKASRYTKAFLHHLTKIDDPIAGNLLTIHNLKFFNFWINQITQYNFYDE